jgi:hypothetical protein
MHERYAYAAIVFLALGIADRTILGMWIVFSIVFILNLLAAIPPTDQIGALLPINGPLGVVGSVAMVAITIAVVLFLARSTTDTEAGEDPDAATASSP